MAWMWARAMSDSIVKFLAVLAVLYTLGLIISYYMNR